MRRILYVWVVLTFVVLGLLAGKLDVLNALFSGDSYLYRQPSSLPAEAAYHPLTWQMLLGRKDKELFSTLKQQQSAVQQQRALQQAEQQASRDDPDPIGQMETDLLISALTANTWQSLDGYQINTEWVGRNVAIPGFIVPVDVERQQLSSFFIVPYYGACLHYPPPPPNQIIYVQLAHSIALPYINNAFLFRGQLVAELFEDPLGTSAWTLTVSDIQRYDGQIDSARLHR